MQTAKDFEKLYRERLGSPAAIENNYTFTFVAPIAYDAVWSLALALNNTDRMLNWPKDTIVQRTHCLDDGIDLAGFRLDNFTYDNSFVGCVIRWNLARTNFVGVSVSTIVYSLCQYINKSLSFHSFPCTTMTCMALGSSHIR